MSDIVEFLEADESQPLVRSAEVVDFDADRGLVKARLVPYEVKVDLYDNVTEVFTRGAFARAAEAPHRVKVTDQQHNRMVVIGNASELRDEADGLYGSLKIADTTAGRDTLTLLRDKVLDELSIEFLPQVKHMQVEQVDGVTHIRHDRARLLGVSPVSQGAYGQNAKVLAVRARQALTEADRAAEEAARQLAEVRKAELQVLRGLSS